MCTHVHGFQSVLKNFIETDNFPKVVQMLTPELAIQRIITGPNGKKYSPVEYAIEKEKIKVLAFLKLHPKFQKELDILTDHITDCANRVHKRAVVYSQMEKHIKELSPKVTVLPPPLESTSPKLQKLKEELAKANRAENRVHQLEREKIHSTARWNLKEWKRLDNAQMIARIYLNESQMEIVRLTDALIIEGELHPREIVTPMNRLIDLQMRCSFSHSSKEEAYVLAIRITNDYGVRVQHLLPNIKKLNPTMCCTIL